MAAILFPTPITAIAAGLESGLIHDLALPLYQEAILVFLLLDCWYYWEHRIFHEVPVLWRVHLVHHSDTAIDVTTARRHHPIGQILVSFLGLILVFALGLSAEALGIYLLVSTIASLYTHANITLPEALDRPLRRVLVTPAVHAIHHSSHQPETDSNYGSVLTVWDRLFGTYSDPAVVGTPRFGLEYFRGPRDTSFIGALLQPFTYSPSGKYPKELTHIKEDTTYRALTPEWQRSILMGAGGMILALLALWPSTLDLARLWSESQTYQYAWLVLPVFAYVVGWHRREDILAMSPQSCRSGLSLALAAIALWGAGYLADVKVAQHLALVILFQGVALYCVGWVVYRRLLPAFLLLFLMVPCGDLMQPLLQNLTIKWLEWFALLWNLPYTLDGFYIQIGEHEYIVVEACAGLAFFTLGGFLGYSFGLLLYKSLSGVIALAAIGAALGILSNVLRVWMIVAVDQLSGTQMRLDAHSDDQWIALVLSLGVLIWLASELVDSRFARGAELTGEHPSDAAGEPAVASR